MLLRDDSEYRYHRMIAIDPGSASIGFSVFELNDTEVIGIESFTLHLHKEKINTGMDIDIYSDRQIRLIKLRELFAEMLVELKPSLIVCESPFYNPRMPGAYAALVEVVTYLKLAVIEYNKDLPFVTLEPSLVKKGVGSAATSGLKLGVKDAIRRNPDIMDHLRVDIEHLDEHAIDSIAVGYSWMKYSMGDYLE